MQFFIVKPSPLPFASLLGPNIHLRILFSNILSLHSSLNNNNNNNNNNKEKDVCDQSINYNFTEQLIDLLKCLWHLGNFEITPLTEFQEVAGVRWIKIKMKKRNTLVRNSMVLQKVIEFNGIVTLCFWV